MTEHKSIAAALAAAVGEVRILGKSERNKFDGYNFVSIDKFLELVNPICAKHGLFPMVSQDEIELYDNVNSKGGKSVWARFYFSITLHHATGETIGPAKSMVAVPMNGAQASGSAQSYALKQFFRATLMIPTGDRDDADLNPTEQHHRQEPRHKPAPDHAQTPQQTQNPQGQNASAKAKALADEMIGAAQKHGIGAVTTNPNFNRDISWLEEISPDEFNRVQAVLDPPRDLSAELQDEIPY